MSRDGGAAGSVGTATAAAGARGARAEVTEVADAPAGDWDARTVAPPGGHVLQGTAWAEHRRGQGWRPRFVTFSDGRVALLLTRLQPPLPGFLAYAPRGPIAGGDPARAVAARAVALGEWVRRQGGTILAVDPELDADPAYDAALAAAGFRPTEEIQPSRHRMVLQLPAGTTEESLLAGMAKGTRQRIRKAEEGGTLVRENGAGERLAEFGTLLDATAERRHFTFAAESGFVDWWRRALGAGVAVFLVAEHGDRLLGGLVAYRQGGHLATAFSADDAGTRREHPGTMHLLRWSIIRRALAEGLPAIDLGGVDLPGHRERPAEGDPGWGLYEHKASFGAEWVESAAAHELIARPWLYRTGLLLRGARRSARRLVGAARRGR
ncbi:MAG TPA: GNAT family N-acetyltransferase [Candidatus Limnocylindrales bacterium]|nr:GNAT family N-acetyltransferase [Candidatus Limnocylindrales bacterium]